MGTQQHLVDTLPLPKKVLEESFVDGEELAAKILGFQQREGADASDARLKIGKRQRENEEGPIVKCLKEGPFRDSIPTPWKTGCYVEGPLKIRWKERLVREEKYKISFNASLQSINGIEYRMSSKGWDLKYTTVSNSDDLIVEGCVKVPLEFGHSFPCILEDLKEILATERETDLQDDTDRAGRESVEVGPGTSASRQ